MLVFSLHAQINRTIAIRKVHFIFSPDYYVVCYIHYDEWTKFQIKIFPPSFSVIFSQQSVPRSQLISRIAKRVSVLLIVDLLARKHSILTQFTLQFHSRYAHYVSRNVLTYNANSWSATFLGQLSIILFHHANSHERVRAGIKWERIIIPNSLLPYGSEPSHQCLTRDLWMEIGKRIMRRLRV